MSEHPTPAADVLSLPHPPPPHLLQPLLEATASLPSSASSLSLPVSRRSFDADMFEHQSEEELQARGVLPRWERRKFAGISITPRSSHSAALLGDKLWIVGGYGGETRKNDVCSEVYCVSIAIDTFQVSSMNPVDRPDRRVGHSMLAIQNNFYVFGGWNGKKYLNYGFLFDTEAEHLLQEKHKGRTTPSPRRDHTMVMLGKRLVLFGGWNIYEQFNDVWTLDKNKWKWRLRPTTGKVPSARRGHSASRVGKKMWVFGGIQGVSRYLADLYVLDLDTFEWEIPACTGEVPSCRAWHTANVVGNSSQILFFGGTAGRVNFYNDCYVLDTARQHWFRLPCTGAPSKAVFNSGSATSLTASEPDAEEQGVALPAGRCSHTATMVGSKLVLFGGLAPSPVDNKINPLNDLWVLETGLSADAVDEDEEDEEKEEDEEEGGESAAAVAAASMGGPTLGGDAFDTGGPHILGAAGSGDSEESGVEGWLSLLTPTIKGDKRDDVWNRRYFRISGTDLLCFQQREKGSVLLTEGLVRLWCDKKFPLSSIAEVPVADASHQSLEEILLDPEQCGLFTEFCKSVHSEENILFYLDVERYRRLSDGSQAQLEAATEIYDKFIKPGSVCQISIPSSLSDHYTTDIRTGQVALTLFDMAQKQVVNTMRVDLLPAYDQHLSTLQSGAKRPAFTIKNALSEADKQLPFCENCLSKFSFHRRRNWCRVCGSVLCSSCVYNQVHLPAKFGISEIVRVCDQCNGHLKGLPFAFSFVSKRRSRPLNLAALSESQMRKWQSGLNQALQINASGPSAELRTQAFSGGAPPAAASASGAGNVGGAASSDDVIGPAATASPSAGGGGTGNAAAVSGTVASAASTEATVESAAAATHAHPTPPGPLHLEGWLLKEDPSTRSYRKRYFILHNDKLFYYQFTLSPEIMRLSGCDVISLSQVDPTLHEVRARSSSETETSVTCLKGGFSLGSGFGHRFNVINPTNQSSLPVSWKLAADGEDNRIFWIDTLQRVSKLKPVSAVQPQSSSPVPRKKRSVKDITISTKIVPAASNEDEVLSPLSQASPLTPTEPELASVPQGEVTVVCANVDGSNTLWEVAADATDEALQTTTDVLKRLGAEFRGYPAQSNGGHDAAVMYTFLHVRDAIFWCMAVQKTLLEVEWHADLASIAESKKEADPASGQLLFHGPRVRIALNAGRPRCVVNPVTGRMEFSGPVVTVASLLCEAASGGQVVCTEAVRQALERAIKLDEERKDEAVMEKHEAKEDDHEKSLVDEEEVEVREFPHLKEPLSSISVTDAGELEAGDHVTDVTGTVKVFSLLPQSLAARQFGPLRPVMGEGEKGHDSPSNSPPPPPPPEDELDD